jgi:hypothetical protein
MVALLMSARRWPSDVTLPRNRWAEHQARIVMVDEQGILVFLFNIAFSYL